MNHLKNLSKWFPDNQVQGNSGKCNSILNANEYAKIQIGKSLIESTNCEETTWCKN